MSLLLFQNCKILVSWNCPHSFVSKHYLPYSFKCRRDLYYSFICTQRNTSRWSLAYASCLIVSCSSRSGVALSRLKRWSLILKQRILIWSGKDQLSNSNELSAPCTDSSDPARRNHLSANTNFSQRSFSQRNVFSHILFQPRQKLNWDWFKPVVFCVVLPSTEFLDN